MSFIVLENLQKPLPKRRFTFITSIRLVRPLYKMARYTYRGSRFLIKNLRHLTTKWRGSPQDESVVRSRGVR